MNRAYTTNGHQEMIEKQANSFFVNYAKQTIFSRLKQRRNGRTHLPVLNEYPSPSIQTASETLVPVKEIVGSVNPGRAQDFDADFRPRTSQTKERWLSIAGQLIKGRSLPPIQLVHTKEGYFVSDGHHRVSVYNAMARDTIKAVVIPS